MHAASRPIRSPASPVRVGLFRAGPGGAWVSVDEHWCRITGMTPDQAVEFGWLRGVAREDREEVAALWAKAVEAGGGFWAEYRLSEGTARVATAAAPVRNEAGVVTGYIGTTTDMTWRKEPGETRRRRHAAYWRLLESSLIALVTGDPEGRITSCNDAFLALTGYTSGDLLSGRIRWHEIVGPECRDLRTCGTFGRISETGFRRATGGTVPVAAGLMWLEKARLEWACLAFDLTGCKWKSGAVGLLAAGLAHRFNNLLTVIIGNAVLVQDTLHANADARTNLDAIIQAGEHASAVVRRLLACAGKTTCRAVPARLSDIVNAVIPSLRGALPRHVELRLELSNDLPPVMADFDQMADMIAELVSNACEAITASSGTIRVTTGTRSAGDHVQLDCGSLPPGTYVFLEVTDNGCGMDPVARARMFDPFFTTKLQGLGLGLAAVSGLVRLHNGFIQVDTAPTRGTAFRVYFPALAAARSAPGLL